MDLVIRAADRGDGALVGQMVADLLAELVGHIRNVDPAALGNVATALLRDGSHFVSFLAEQRNGQCLGCITVSTAAAVYAGGLHGVIEELYVKPSHRAHGVGKRLIDHTVAYARAKAWSRLEVSTPEGEAWRRTLGFYLREGFVSNHTGARLKRSLA